MVRVGAFPKNLQQLMSREAVEMNVESVAVEAADTKTIRLKWTDGYNPEFKTGQYPISKKNILRTKNK